MPLWEDRRASGLEGGPKERLGGRGRGGGLTQDQRGPAGDAGLQALVENLVQKHDGLTGKESREARGC